MNWTKKKNIRSFHQDQLFALQRGKKISRGTQQRSPFNGLKPGVIHTAICRISGMRKNYQESKENKTLGHEIARHFLLRLKLEVANKTRNMSTPHPPFHSCRMTLQWETHWCLIVDESCNGVRVTWARTETRRLKTSHMPNHRCLAWNYKTVILEVGSIS